MSAEQQTGTELEVPQHVTTVGQLSPLLSDDEIRRLFRTADALARSGIYKDVRQAEQAFAKLIIGRDLGLSAAQAMQGVQFVEGGIQMHYAMLGQFVKATPGHGYRAGWLKRDDPAISPDDEEWPGPLDFVWMDKEAPDDLRPIYGAVVVFTVDDKQVGVSRFTEDDARQANLIKDGLDRRATWNTSRRNMLIARAMSNGVKWFVPEALGGMPVYVEGELPPRRAELTQGSGSGDAPGIELDPKVEEVIARATELGHAGYSNRESIELTLGSRSPQVVKDWVAAAKVELDRMEAEHDQPVDGGPLSDEEEVTGEVEEPKHRPDDDTIEGDRP